MPILSVSFFPDHPSGQHPSSETERKIRRWHSCSAKTLNLVNSVEPRGYITVSRLLVTGVTPTVTAVCGFRLAGRISTDA